MLVVYIEFSRLIVFDETIPAWIILKVLALVYLHDLSQIHQILPKSHSFSSILSILHKP